MQRTGGPPMWDHRDSQGSPCAPPPVLYGHSPSPPPLKYSPQVPPPPLPPPPYQPHNCYPGPPPRDCPPPYFQDGYGTASELPLWQRDDNFLPPRHTGDFHIQHPSQQSYADDDFDPPPPPPPYPPRGHPGMRSRGESHSRRGMFSENAGSLRGRGGNQNLEPPSVGGKSPLRGAPYTRGTGMFHGRGESMPRGSTNFRGSASGRSSYSTRGSPSFRGANPGRGRGGKTQSNGSIVGNEANKTSKSPFANKNKEKQQGGTIKAAVPGNANFISFKNSLQECCQKKQLSVPSYVTFKNGYGFSAKVSVEGNTFASTGIQATGKDAEQNAAHAALISLQLIDASVKFDAKASTAVKRPAAIDNSIEQDGKRIKVESKANMGYKSQLNEFCQKFHLAIPVYECKSDKRKGFSCTVLFNSKTYESHSRQPTKKQAEQNAAQVVLSVLNQCPPPAPNFQDYIEQCRQLSSQNTEADSTTTTAVIAASTSITASPVGTMLSSPIAAQAAHTVASYKNKLQEYCQKSKLAMPVYHSTRQDGVFSCTVEVAGKTFASTGCNTKKGCEQTAANVALKALGLV